jgi:hypothetical protein
VKYMLLICGDESAAARAMTVAAGGTRRCSGAGCCRVGRGCGRPPTGLDAALRRGRPGRYQVQAAIAACHATAADAADTDTERRYLTHRLAQTTNRT